MWKEVNTRQTVTWSLVIGPALDEAMRAYLERKGGRRCSRSQFVQKAVLQKLERDERLLAGGMNFDDWMGLSDRLAERRMVEKRRERRSLRWCVVLDATVDGRVRAFLREYGARHGALCRFVEDAVREAMTSHLPLSARGARARLEGVPPAHMIAARSELRVL